MNKKLNIQLFFTRGQLRSLNKDRRKIEKNLKNFTRLTEPTYRLSLVYLVEMATAKSVKSKLWFCRVDGAKEFLEEKLKQLSADCVSILSAYHEGDKKENPHCHFVCEMPSETQKQSFALKVKTLFSITKKTQYALGVWDGGREYGAVSYLFHEPNAPLLVKKGYTEEELQKAVDINNGVQKVMEINKEKASHKLIEKAYEYMKDKEWNRVSCLAYMLKVIKKGENYHPGDYMLKRYVEEIEVRMLDEDNVDIYASELASRLWR